MQQNTSADVQSLRVVNLDTEASLLSNGNTANLVEEATPSSLAYVSLFVSRGHQQCFTRHAIMHMYVLFTSGSTGHPKGCMLHHAALLNYVHWHIDYYQLTAKDRCAIFRCVRLFQRYAHTRGGSSRK